MRAVDSVRFTNISATPPDFLLQGGIYQLAVVGTFGTSVTLQHVAADGTTGLTAITALTANGVGVSLGLPPGLYRLLLTSMTAVYAVITRIPQE